jgi:O-antigen/teichoic acid export membrane protein
MANAFFMYVDKLIAVPLFGYLVLGYYQIAFQFLMFLGMIPISFYQYLLPEQSAAQSPGSARNKMSSVQAFGFILASSLAILMFFLGPIIIPIIFENFSESSDAIRIMSIGIVPMMLVWNLNSRFTSLGNTRFVFIGSMLYLVIQIGLMVSLGSVLGATGIALATVAGLSSQGLFLLALAYRQRR